MSNSTQLREEQTIFSNVAAASQPQKMADASQEAKQYRGGLPGS